MGALIRAYDRLVQARERVKTMAPTVDLRNCGQAWIDAVTERTEAEKAFHDEAEKHCENLRRELDRSGQRDGRSRVA